MALCSVPELKKKIETRSAVISIIGLGYVGLPLAVIFAEEGFPVIGIDSDPERVEAINRGESYIEDVPSEKVHELIGAVVFNAESNKKRFRATDDYDALHCTDVVVVCVPTPLSKTRDPDLSYIATATEQIGDRLHKGMLIVLESTAYPGTTEELMLPKLQESASKSTSGEHYIVGKDYFLAFSPERIDPGRTDWTIRNTPKVVGGVTPTCGDAAVALYQTVVDQVIPVSSTTVAEMVKLLENTFRATNIALVNEMAIICDKLGVDVWEVIEAAKSKPFGFMHFYPGPGLGGHCIPVDPQYLAWKLKSLNYNARFIQLAEEINFGMPGYVLMKIGSALNEDKKPIRGSRVLILGVTYKANVNDMRESPALDIIHLLLEKGAEVTYHDPHVSQIEKEGIALHSIDLDREALSGADCVVIAADHCQYDWNWVVKNSSLIVDTRNATKNVPIYSGRVVKI